MLEYPATSRQEWHLKANYDGTSSLSCATVLVFRNGCNWDAVVRSLGKLAARHDALRTTLETNGENVSQCVWADSDLDNLLTAPTGAGFADDPLQDVVLTAMDLPFMVPGGGLSRAYAVDLAPSTQAVIVLTHHSICDGWSDRILFRDLTEFYRADVENRAPALPPLAVGSGHYAIGESRAAAKSPEPYWRELLTATAPRLPLPGARGTDSGAAMFASCELPLIDAAKAVTVAKIARSQRTTPARAVLAAVAASLIPVMGPQMTLGLWVSNRDGPEFGEVVGELANLLPIPIDGRDDPPFADFVGRVSRSVSAALEHSAPLASLAPLIRQLRKRNDGPLVDVTVNYLQPPNAAIGKSESRDDIQKLQPASDRHEFPIDNWWDGFGIVDYQFRPQPNGEITGYLLHNAMQVEPEAATGFAHAADAVLTSVGTDPEQPLSRLAGIGNL